MSLYNGDTMMFCGGKGSGEQGASQVSMKDVTPEERVKRVQEHMEQYVDLVSKRAPAEEIKKAESELSREMGKDTFEAFKRQLPKQLRVRRSLDAQRVYQHFRLPGRQRMVHDRRGMGREGARAKHESYRTREHMHVREGKLTREEVRKYVNYLADRMHLRPEGKAHTPEMRAKVDEFLSAFEKMIVRRFEGDRQVARQLKDNKPVFLKKTAAQWQQFFSRFAGRILKKKVPTRNIKQFLFRGLVPKGSKGVVVTDMTLVSGRVERFIRFGILADAMAKLAKMMPGQTFGREFLSGEELLYLALAAARGREYVTGLRPREGKFMAGVAEERAAQELGLPLATHLRQKTQDIRKGKGFGALRGWKDKEFAEEELPYQFIPWWHWGNLKRPGKFRMTTVAFYIALGLVTILGIIAITSHLLRS